MELLVGSTFGIDRVRDQNSVVAQDKAVPTAMFLSEESSSGGSRIGLRKCIRSPPGDLSESSSSVGVSGENSENEEEEDDSISSQGRWLDSFSSSLEDSLPIKRGLSNHYIGKSKSFGNLMEASNAKNLEKVESPLNKKRRLLISSKLRRRSSLSSFSIYSNINPNSMPLLALQESDEYDHRYNDDNDGQTSNLQEKRTKIANSCFCLSTF